MQLENRKIIVTGGARGIGASTVRTLTAEGARVASLDILDAEGGSVAKQANAERPDSVRFYHCDISDSGHVETAFGAAVAWLGGLDVLANIAGVERGGPAESLPVENAELILRVNVMGTMLTNQAAFGYLKDAGGVIINVGSDAGLAGYRGLAAYGASKGAVMAWTRNVALEWGSYGITVNSLVPAIWTPMYEEHRARMTPDELAAHDAGMAHGIVIGGKLGDPVHDLGPVMVFLASGGARFVTGQIIAVNGGVGMSR
jgi:NAD(P)-dependent dehydrogenase (short-subunit alcohol dehydrogenase family)